MKKKHRGLTMTVFALVLSAIAAYYVINKPHRDVQQETPVIISSTDLVAAYQADEEAANRNYLNNALQVTGTVGSVEKNNDGQTVITLSGANPLSGVRCTLQKDKAIKIGTLITLKGRCTGYLTDVVVIDCRLIE